MILLWLICFLLARGGRDHAWTLCVLCNGVVIDLVFILGIFGVVMTTHIVLISAFSLVPFKWLAFRREVTSQIYQAGPGAPFLFVHMLL